MLRDISYLMLSQTLSIQATDKKLRHTVIQVAFIFYKTGWLVHPFISVWFQDVLEIQKNLKTECASRKTRPMSLKKKIIIIIRRIQE